MVKNKQASKKYKTPSSYSVPRAILDILLDLGDSVTVFETPYLTYKRQYREFMGDPDLKNWRYNRAIQYLQKSAQVRVIKKKDKKFLLLTKKGKINALMNRLGSDLDNTQPWDGKWRLIIWDIPEQSRKQRDQIRRFIKKRGFFMLQQSVFATPHPLPKSAVEYLKESGLLKFIRFMRVDKIDDEKDLKKYFNL